MLNSKPFNVLNKSCPSRQVLELIADKWAILVLYSLAYKTMRYGELQRTIGGVSKKMLTQTLRELERNGLISRTVYQVIPPHVEYALTPLGSSLRAQMGGLCAWAEDHLDAVHQARAQYDSAAGKLDEIA
ncbi:MAG: helix-turn-helix domain-containing protein [Anaerolineae bacterium]